MLHSRTGRCSANAGDVSNIVSVFQTMTQYTIFVLSSPCLRVSGRIKRYAGNDLSRNQALLGYRPAHRGLSKACAANYHDPVIPVVLAVSRNN